MDPALVGLRKEDCRGLKCSLGYRVNFYVNKPKEHSDPSTEAKAGRAVSPRPARAAQ